MQLKLNDGAVDDNLASMFEIYRDAAIDDALHLAKPPIGLRRMAHDRTWFQKFVHTLPTFTSPPSRHGAI